MARVDVLSPTPGSVWMQSASVGQVISQGSVVVIIEVMKTELPVEAPCAGKVVWLAEAGSVVERDDVVATIETAP